MNWLTLAQAAEVLQVSPKTIRRRIATGDLVAYRLGLGPRAAIRLREKDVQALLVRIRVA